MAYTSTSQSVTKGSQAGAETEDSLACPPALLSPLSDPAQDPLQVPTLPSTSHHHEPGPPTAITVQEMLDRLANLNEAVSQLRLSSQMIPACIALT